MRSKSDNPAAGAGAAAASGSYDLSTLDPILHLFRFLPYSFLRPPRTRLRLPSTLALPSPMTVFSLLLLTYFSVVSGIVYDVIVEPPGIGSTQDHATGTVRPVVFLPGRVNGQYIIEGLSSGFMFVLGGLGLIFMDLAVDRHRARSIRLSFALFGISAVVISYLMSMLFIRIKIPGYLCSGKEPSAVPGIHNNASHPNYSRRNRAILGIMKGLYWLVTKYNHDREDNLGIIQGEERLCPSTTRKGKLNSKVGNMWRMDRRCKMTEDGKSSRCKIFLCFSYYSSPTSFNFFINIYLYWWIF